jgi:hypothetical protein
MPRTRPIWLLVLRLLSCTWLYVGSGSDVKSRVERGLSIEEGARFKFLPKISQLSFLSFATLTNF